MLRRCGLLYSKVCVLVVPESLGHTSQKVSRRNVAHHCCETGSDIQRVSLCRDAGVNHCSSCHTHVLQAEHQRVSAESLFFQDGRVNNVPVVPDGPVRGMCCLFGCVANAAKLWSLCFQLGKIEVGSALFPINHAMTDAIEKLFST